LGTPVSGLVGYKMRFEDRTARNARIKIMTDSILLQEIKLDPWLSRYSLLVVGEAHERSLNIGFTLGLWLDQGLFILRGINEQTAITHKAR
jgi:HrpA-like RNA helicase